MDVTCVGEATLAGRPPEPDGGLIVHVSEETLMGQEVHTLRRPHRAPDVGKGAWKFRVHCQQRHELHGPAAGRGEVAEVAQRPDINAPGPRIASESADVALRG